MEQYNVKRTDAIQPVVEGRYFTRIHQRQIDAYGEIGANNIVQNVRATYGKLMHQLRAGLYENHNSLLVGKVQSGKTSNLELFVKNCLEICPRQALHAKTLGFIHPRSGEELYFDSEWPDDFRLLIEKWRRFAQGKEE